MNRKYLIIAGGVAAAALVGFYLASPLLAFNGLKNAARDGDRDKLERLVDFPAVRDSLKSQLQTAFMARMNADPEMRDNPFSGFAMMMVPAMVNGAVDVYVTADGMANLVQGRKPAEKGPAPVTPMEEPVTSYGYTDIDTFKVTVDSAEAEPMALVMRRQGLFAWQLKLIELPADLLKEPVETAAPPIGGPVDG